MGLPSIELFAEMNIWAHPRYKYHVSYQSKEPALMMAALNWKHLSNVLLQTRVITPSSPSNPNTPSLGRSDHVNQWAHQFENSQKSHRLSLRFTTTECPIHIWNERRNFPAEFRYEGFNIALEGIHSKQARRQGRQLEVCNSREAVRPPAVKETTIQYTLHLMGAWKRIMSINTLRAQAASKWSRTRCWWPLLGPCCPLTMSRPLSCLISSVNGCGCRLQSKEWSVKHGTLEPARQYQISNSAGSFKPISGPFLLMSLIQLNQTKRKLLATHPHSDASGQTCLLVYTTTRAYFFSMKTIVPARASIVGRWHGVISSSLWLPVFPLI